MLEFALETNQRNINYKINWDIKEEGYQRLFLKYSNISNILSIESEKVRIIDQEEVKVLPVYPKRGIAGYEKLSKVPYATYRFALYQNQGCEDKPLKVIEHRHSPEIMVNKKEIPAEDEGFSYFQLSCRYKIPSSMMKLSLKGMAQETFILPEMMEENNRFVTRCLIKKGYSQYLNVIYSPEIKDFIIGGNDL